MELESAQSSGAPDEALSHLTDALAAKGYAVLENVLSAADCQALKTEMDALSDKGSFKAAGVGRGDRHVVRTDIRSDQIRWLDELTLTPAESAAWETLDSLRIGLNRSLYLGLRWFESHLAIYPAGGHYAKHVDRFTDASARAVSFVLYLNHGWTQEDGGALRLYQRDDHEAIDCEILPTAGTLVVFLSGEIPHEVLPPKRPRYSITGWYRTDEPR